jgi:hypothetical protein
MAEGEGFEPPVPFPVQRFSRPPVSTTHTSLRVEESGLWIVYNTPQPSLVTIPRVLCSQEYAGNSVWLMQVAVCAGTLLIQQSEGAGMKFHHFREVNEEVRQTVIPRIGAVFMLHSLFFELLM